MGGFAGLGGERELVLDVGDLQAREAAAVVARHVKRVIEEGGELCLRVEGDERVVGLLLVKELDSTG